MNLGYITFVNDNPIYRSLLDILIESVTFFSKYPIHVFTINFDLKTSNPKVITSRINLSDVNFATICYSKLLSSINSDFDYAVQLDSDFIITDQMDLLFDNIKDINTLPLGSLHPLDPENQQNIMNCLGVDKKTQPYVHGTYLFGKNTLPFLEECYDFSNFCLKNNIIPENYDETIFNVMLWKYKSNKWLDTYDIFFEEFLNRNSHGNYPKHFNLNYYSCHGQKNPSEAKKILKSLFLNYENTNNTRER